MPNITKKQIAILIGIILAAIVGSQAINNSQSEELTGTLKLKKGYYQEKEKEKEKAEKSDRNVQKEEEEEETVPEYSPSEEEQTSPENATSDEAQSIEQEPVFPETESENDSYTEYTASCPENYEVVFDLNSDNNVLNLGALSSVGCSFKIAIIKEYSGIETYECISTLYQESASPTYDWSCFSLRFNSRNPVETIISITSYGAEEGEEISVKEITKRSPDFITTARDISPRELIIKAQR